MVVLPFASAVIALPQFVSSSGVSAGLTFGAAGFGAAFGATVAALASSSS